MHKLGVIIPYRNREEHLEEFLPALQTYLTRKGIEYLIYIVEQDDGKAFNRGALCNIGFKAASQNRCDYVIFHDVDMIPMNVDYSYSDKPIHLASDDLPFDSYFGGVTLFPTETFKKINGFSNNYWGWGYEDDDLLYRCISHKVPLKKRKVKIEQINKESVIFNGVNAFAKAKNVLNCRRSFTIRTKVSIGDVYFNPDSPSDVFPIFNLKGYDFELSYTSFKRLVVKVFDNKTKYYQIYSDVTKEKEFDIVLEYSHKDNVLTFTVNDKEVGNVKLESNMYNYNSSKALFIGADSDIENFFHGIIRTFSIEDENGETVIDYDSTSIEHYKLKDKSSNENNAIIFNAALEVPDLKEEQILHTPHRRQSLLRRLKHPSSGFNGGRWESDLTRWNELRFINQVSKGSENIAEDGLNNISPKVHSTTRSDDRKVRTIKVGL
jgi:hypothetical protein